jgi:ABC-type bacteriocin/lantibiotic exporter with double-glycine peptidase domain
MKAVVQEELTGCGIAACAAIADISYAKAKNIANKLGIYSNDATLWSEKSYILKLLAQLGFQTCKQETPFSDWDSLPDRALLAIKWHLDNGKPFWHWVVFVRDGNQSYVLDSKKSLKTNVRTDFGRIKPKWYIEVRSKYANNI